MARLSPPLDERRPTKLGWYTELTVLKLLRQGLEDRVHIFRGLNWIVTGAAVDHHRELDIVVVNFAGAVAVLEGGAGALTHDGSTVSKAYGVESKDVVAKARRQFSGFLSRLKLAQLGERLLHLLVLLHQSDHTPSVRLTAFRHSAASTPPITRFQTAAHMATKP
ncbi:hypothetical protein ACWA7J_05815 [Leptothrix sp. BB-4]